MIGLSGQVLAVGADALAIGKVRPHQLVLVHNDGHLAINPQQHQQVGRCKNVRKMELHGSSEVIDTSFLVMI